MISKKNLPHFITVVSFVFFIVLGLACASSPGTTSGASAGASGGSAGTSVVKADGNSPGMDLDAAIKEAAAQMETKIPSETMIALVSVASSSAQLSEYVISRLEAALVSGGKLVVVDRANLDKVREEQGFQMSGEVDDESAKNIGKLLGAGAIVTGSFTNLGDVYGLALKAINMETATVAVSYPADIARSTRIETLLAGGGGAAGSGRTAQTATEPVYEKEYKIGDAGPAGGIVFYDQGFVMDGWRYLEAAPKDFPNKVEWGNVTSSVRAEVGTGKANTGILLSALNRSGETLRAAQVVNVPKYGGYDDWFLPSRDELKLVYQNLQQKGLGGFLNEAYWSSSYNAQGSYHGPFYVRFSNGNVGSNWYPNGRFSLLVRGIRRF